MAMMMLGVCLMLGCFVQGHGVTSSNMLETKTAKQFFAIDKDWIYFIGNYCLARAEDGTSSGRAYRPGYCFMKFSESLREKCMLDAGDQSCRKTLNDMRSFTTKIIALRAGFDHLAMNTGFCQNKRDKVKTYDKDKQICCPGGGIHRRKFDSNICCSGSLYDGRRFICCNDSIYHLNDTADGRYSATTEMCCQNGTEMQCSDVRVIPDNERYNESTQDNSERSFKAYTDGDSSTENKGRKHLISDVGFCQNKRGKLKTYDKNKQICCPGGGIHRRKFESNLCCGGSLYDGRRFICCNDSPYHLNATADGRNSATTEICCQNETTIQCSDARVMPDNERYDHASMGPTQDVSETSFEADIDYDTSDEMEGRTRVIVMTICAFLVISVFISVLTLGIVKLVHICTGRGHHPNETRHMHSQTDKIAFDQSFVSSNTSNRSNQTQTRSTSPNDNPPDTFSLVGANIFSISTRVQTDDQKTMNMTDSMGNVFTAHHVFDKQNRTLTLPKSTVRITVSEADVEHDPLECYASSFHDRAAIHRKLDSELKEDRTIASPAVEFKFPAKNQLNDFATVEMPFCGRNIDVIKVQSDQDFHNKAKIQSIPKYDNIEAVPQESTAFYIVIDGQKVVIYTRTFSWFICLECLSRHENDLTGALYYTIGAIGTKYKCSVYLYIMDKVFFRFEDYNHKLLDTTSKEATTHQTQLKLPTNVPKYSLLRGRLIIEDSSSNIWKHKLDPERQGRQLHDQFQEIRMEDVLRCERNVRQGGLPHCFQWKLETTSRDVPVILESIVKVEHAADEQTDRAFTTIFEIAREIQPGQKYEDPFPVTTNAVQPYSDMTGRYHPQEAVPRARPHPELPSADRYVNISEKTDH